MAFDKTWVVAVANELGYVPTKTDAHEISIEAAAEFSRRRPPEKRRGPIPDKLIASCLEKAIATYMMAKAIRVANQRRQHKPLR